MLEICFQSGCTLPERFRCIRTFGTDHTCLTFDDDGIFVGSFFIQPRGDTMLLQHVHHRIPFHDGSTKNRILWIVFPTTIDSKHSSQPNLLMARIPFRSSPLVLCTRACMIEWYTSQYRTLSSLLALLSSSGWAREPQRRHI
jgi:hypothetical protein